MDVISGRKKKNDCETQKGNVEYGHDLNKFYAGFDCHDFADERGEKKKKTLKKTKQLTSVDKRIVLKGGAIYNV